MLLIRNANIKTMAGPDLKNGCLLLENGKIAAVGQTVDAPEGVETLDAQSLVDLLIQYNVLADGTKAVSYKTEGSVASEEAGPGIAKPQPGMPTEAPTQQDEYGTLELSQFPDDAKDQTVQAIVNTFTENLNVQYLTIKAGDKTIADNQGFSDK